MIDPANEPKEFSLPDFSEELEELKQSFDATLQPFRDALAATRYNRSLASTDEQTRMRLAHTMLSFIRDGCSIMRDMVYAGIIPLEGDGLIMTREVVDISQSVLNIDNHTAAVIEAAPEPPGAEVIEFPVELVASPEDDETEPTNDDETEPSSAAETVDVKPTSGYGEQVLPETLEIHDVRIDTARLGNLNEHEKFILLHLGELTRYGSFTRSDVFEIGFGRLASSGARNQAFPKAMQEVISCLEIAAGKPVIYADGERSQRKYLLSEPPAGLEQRVRQPKARPARIPRTRRTAAPEPAQEPVAAIETKADPEADSEPEEGKATFVNAGLVGELKTTSDEPLELRVNAKPAIEEIIAQRLAKTTASLALHDRAVVVLSRHFGVGGGEEDLGMDIISLSDQINQSPYTIRNFIREALKSSDDPAAKAYLEYLDAQ